MSRRWSSNRSDSDSFSRPDSPAVGAPRRQSAAEVMLRKLKRRFLPARQSSGPSFCGYNGSYCPASSAAADADPGRQRRLSSHDCVQFLDVSKPTSNKPKRREKRSQSLIAGLNNSDTEDRRFYSSSDDDGYSYPALDDAVLEMQKRIYRAKSDAKTVSLVGGNLYIDYQYVGPLPPGCHV